MRLRPIAIKKRGRSLLVATNDYLIDEPADRHVQVGSPPESQYRNALRTVYVSDIAVGMLQHSDLLAGWVATLGIYQSKEYAAAREQLAHWYETGPSKP
jgi:hypothetical protein